jgi:hypothetical protein
MKLLTRWEGYVANMERRGMHIGKRPVGRPRRRWEYNTKVNFRDIGWGGMEWVDLAQDKDQWSEHGNEPLSSIKYW